MAELKRLFGTSNQSLTISLNSLASNAARQSTEVDNSSNLFLDALLSVVLVSASSSVSSTGVANIFAFGTADGGTNRTEGAGASDASITLADPSNLLFVGSVSIVANSTTYKAGPFSIAKAFGGVLPERWGVVIENRSGTALNSSGHSAYYQGVKLQVV
jgi:hypothetical protein